MLWSPLTICPPSPFSRLLASVGQAGGAGAGGGAYAAAASAAAARSHLTGDDATLAAVAASSVIPHQHRLLSRPPPPPTRSLFARHSVSASKARGSSTCKLEKQCRKQMSGKVVLLPPFCLFVYLYLFIYLFIIDRVLI